ncbi:hypothetical protein [Streptomyces hiroshimensis]|uniref:Uncharacterized protein n=1 Tax=Streptomyces hiroshimensis TaxID=66424 RepID=A0ABQ2Y427_9ACTN|nr:hypothetical protein [Streptomyces hiroshimensis]GGX63256.1 hypothetical protein GCM10010324_05010 [Streptomyces hiroshimensis]
MSGSSIERSVQVTSGQDLSDQAFESFLWLIADSLERLGGADLHMAASLRDRTFKLAMDIEGETAEEAHRRFDVIFGAVMRDAHEALREVKIVPLPLQEVCAGGT